MAVLRGQHADIKCSGTTTSAENKSIYNVISTISAHGLSSKHASYVAGTYEDDKHREEQLEQDEVFEQVSHASLKSNQ